ncbi:ATP-grasp domain-containing protein, partial [Enterococcus faecalis]|uniref:ATP-grasp domain-containing protein n=1 Tax=Enterococcus faecalis TaxID=1351 RepID=UPI003D6B2EE8
AEKIEEIHDFFDKINKPVIVKPIDSQGSRGIRVIRSKSEAADALCYALSYSRVKKVIVEEFITGKEYVVEGVVYEGFFTNLV